MRSIHLTKVMAICSLAAGLQMVEAQTPVITSFQGNGQLTWTNGLNTNAIYQIEWASTLTGTWCRSFQNLNYIEAQSNTSFTVNAPMFYRVIMTTTPPPAGMVLIDAGPFQMGYPDCNPTGTGLSIFVSAFYTDRYHVTKNIWDQVRNWGLTNGYPDIAVGQAGSTGSATSSNHPVTKVSWYDCVKWCNARSEKSHLTPVYYTSASQITVYRTGTNDLQSSCVMWNANGYRLPTECEWEKAARGGLVSKIYPWGNSIDGSMLNCSNSGDPWDNGTTPVGYYNGNQIPAGQDMANGYGLYDMAGNVYQICWDWYTNSPPVNSSVDPTGPSSSTTYTHIVRGGPWENGAGSVYYHTAFRGAESPGDNTETDTGFRSVRRP